MSSWGPDQQNGSSSLTLDDLPHELLREVVTRLPRSQMGPLRACSHRLYAMCCSLLPCATVPLSSLGPTADKEGWSSDALLPAKLQHLTSLTLIGEGWMEERRARLVRLLWLQANSPLLISTLQHLNFQRLGEPLLVARAVVPRYGGHLMRALRRVDLGDVQGGGLVAATCAALCDVPVLSHLTFTSPEPEIDLSPLAGLRRLRRLDFASTLTLTPDDERSTRVTGALITHLTSLDLNISAPWEEPLEDHLVPQSLGRQLLSDVVGISGLRSLRLAGMQVDPAVEEDDEDSYHLLLGALSVLTTLTRLVLDPAGWSIDGLEDEALFDRLVNLRALSCWLWVPLQQLTTLRQLHTLWVASVRCRSVDEWLQPQWRQRVSGNSPLIWEALPSLRHLLLSDSVVDVVAPVPAGAVRRSRCMAFRKAGGGVVEEVALPDPGLDKLWEACIGDDIHEEGSGEVARVA